jgi:hypothetical protein
MDEAFARDPIDQYPEDVGFDHVISLELNFCQGPQGVFPLCRISFYQVYTLNGLTHMIWYTQPII